MYILLVDNNQFFISVIHEMLHEAGFNNIKSVDNGIESIPKFYDIDIPEVVIIDHNQCYSRGVDVIQTIRQSSPDISIIVLTESGSYMGHSSMADAGSIIHIEKNQITADNLPQILYDIFTEKLHYSRKSFLPKSLSRFRKTFAEILN